MSDADDFIHLPLKDASGEQSISRVALRPGLGRQFSQRPQNLVHCAAAYFNNFLPWN
jgi:hypothetical protein